MNSRQRNVLIRMLIALGIFVYVGYVAYQQLPRFDFTVIFSFFLLYLVWTIIMECGFTKIRRAMLSKMMIVRATFICS